MRATFVTDISTPLQPSVNLKYGVNKNLSLRASFSGSVKVPTLNDRYWGGTATELEPEKGFTWEAGADYAFKMYGWSVKSYFTWYYSPIKDWIRWLPAGEVWRPRNVPKIESDGVETGFDAEKVFGSSTWNFSAKYAYTNVMMRESLYSNDPGVDHQVAYQPKHTLIARVGYRYGRIDARLTGTFTGKRTSNDIYDIMKAYFLLNAYLKYSPGDNITISCELNNILNKSYQNVKFYAMPGFNFSAGLQIKF